MKQYEAVIRTIENLGGIATLGQINQEIFKIEDCEWKTKTPYASIRRTVQLDKNIYKIKPGLYALVKYKDKFEKQGIIAEDGEEQNSDKLIEFNHSYYQGLLVEIGNMKGMFTYIPSQDKNKLFLHKPLKNVASMEDIYDFTYSNIVRRAKTIDVIWFNERKLPSSIFEVEHSTDIQNSLLKFNDLQDFHSKLYIVSSKNRVKFIDYQYVSDLHTKMSELSAVEQQMKI
ncbi:MAG: hypothetical protein FWE10_03170 [Rikenellaceae bacterium]|nr:hypothetical protein [Rikenellaceae bacterium]MCL2693161.1 hypothetical protein [Rikenellaceae bacterium]